MNYNKMTKSELIVRIEELEQFNQQLMEEKAGKTVWTSPGPGIWATGTTISSQAL